MQNLLSSDSRISNCQHNQQFRYLLSVVCYLNNRSRFIYDRIRQSRMATRSFSPSYDNVVIWKLSIGAQKARNLEALLLHLCNRVSGRLADRRTRPFARTNRPFARMFLPSFYHVDSEKLSRFGNIAMHPPLLPPLIPHIADTIHRYEHIYNTNMHRSYVPSQRTEIALPVYDDRCSAGTRRKFDSMIASD